MRTNLTRRLGPAVGLVAATGLLAGCFSAEYDVTINDDGTADIAVVALIDTERLTELGGILGEDTSGLEGLGGEELLAELTGGEGVCTGIADSFEGYDVTTEAIEEDGRVGSRCVVEGVPIDELTDLGDESSLTISQEGPITRFDAVLEGVDELTGGSEQLVELLDIDLSELFSISVSATAPGSLGENNASSTDGSTATWQITPEAAFIENGDAAMTAEWSTEGGSSNTWLIVLLVIAALALVALVVFLVLRARKDAAGGAAEAPSVGDATTPPPPGTAPPAPGATAPMTTPVTAPPPPPGAVTPPPPGPTTDPTGPSGPGVPSAVPPPPPGTTPPTMPLPHTPEPPATPRLPDPPSATPPPPPPG
jgi:hypothetical protein